MKLFKRIKALSEPYNDRLNSKAQQHFFRDALATPRNRNDLTVSQTQHAIFSYLPSWVNGLMNIRNKVVAVFGFEVGRSHKTPHSDELGIGDEAGFLTVIEKHSDEIISIADDKHMTFYLSVAFVGDDVVVSSLVNQKTMIGRIYVNSILPFHYFIARMVINNAIKAGRI
ncbi:DUF2867 domain-containing protein [Psychrobium sp. 1_MG-2023]|uniref:DUF2867 domain-containing protein n=1 Tax=Psychrobium sp. 1_MG-2023 TaxID=3062624 RepID=UPI0026903911|nr:DUF2867 domain-containing protein [Psychrobium sp. 1_MG-2023]MDP2562796.1 DUF2867 domain-containing protein [Psychrobium sp. 1_MG-2023]